MFDKIVEIVSALGYVGVFLLMLLENIFPPIPSELIMPLAGFVAARGDLNFIAVILVGTAGSVVGALPWYYAGAKLGQKRMKHFAERWGHWLTLSPEDVDKASEWFDRHGKGAVFFGRLIPAVRTLISVPAGIAGMSMTKFLIYSTLGSLIWTALLALAGYLLESQYQKVSEYLNPVSTAIVVLMVLYYLYRLIRQRFASKKQ
ncbi:MULTISPECIES: DedA family protein [Pseudomonadaceae]|jgi:membrane protein DedA with SNARE-associated domain|uniref:Alkaline phosphatase n=1 Tax=Stutzerimonas stutzeri TaxID=316 RepID=A0A172WN11_STUST|nr:MULTISPECIES: DedA family protein [Pseudomonadaceae]MBU0949990.1 DedA family protein [Gammaproteobacteria bacterium]HBM07396.1 DedA family protein [Pseudomonas sp.]ANF24780.1 alkaline phosphatase [Stutzerimonas stutzeri]KJJ62413.1 alkaline phosphatase [Pseudomonas sp. 10B238]MBK3794111.1 DedA family protein [Stutzerimonas stutzeri]